MPSMCMPIVSIWAMSSSDDASFAAMALIDGVRGSVGDGSASNGGVRSAGGVRCFLLIGASSALGGANVKCVVGFAGVCQAVGRLAEAAWKMGVALVDSAKRGFRTAKATSEWAGARNGARGGSTDTTEAHIFRVAIGGRVERSGKNGESV
jgi:hypothetical protein